MVASRATSSAQDCSDDIQGAITSATTVPTGMTTSQLDHYGLRIKCYLQLLQQKQQLLLVLFVLQPQKYGTAYPSQSNQPRPSTSSAACLKDTCLAMPLDDRHSHPEPLHRRLSVDELWRR